MANPSLPPVGMVFDLGLPDHPTGVPTIRQNWQDVNYNAETAFPADWILIVQNVPTGVTPATVAALIQQYVSLPLPFGAGCHWKVNYSSLNAPLVATVF